ncbi:hypothetical protein A4X06_0g3473 [Tilletia controversa]|uniref:C3H1-type domain-containing protein n=1 Tax=Tilletia controversa TaxID=13291 RepID=A0A8X7MUG6_9BASI|nr:hypothetical protein CF328_g3672 [Tilletia controversa]KAE8248897.1 hypothetical protein A4X06_0g3473 [Tilletia controversa]
MADLIAPTKAGDVQAVRNLFDGQQHVELEAQDEAGWTALMHAAKLGNGELVQELLARGADPREAAAQDLANEHPHVAAMVVNAANAGAQGFQYMPAGNFPGYANVNPTQGAGQYGYAPQGASEFYYPPPQPMVSSMGMPEQSDPPVEDNKPIEVNPANLPPPDVARNIPCRYFPNCKYGAKCIFAHAGPAGVLPPAPSAMPPVQRDGAPFSPADGRAPMSPMSAGMPPHSTGAPVYFQPPPTYGYAPMYGPPQPFYAPMAPPMPHMQYGMPMHYGPPPPMGPGAIASPDAQMSSPANAMPFSPQQVYDTHSPQQPNTGAPQFIPEHQRKQSGAMLTSPQQVGPGPLMNSLPNGDASGHMHGNALAHGIEYGGPMVDENGAGSSAVTPHRRQSFNSFLNRHTVQVPNQGPVMGGMPSFQPSRGIPGGKGGRRGTGSYGGIGPLGFHKTEGLPLERPPCSFFARAQCKNGDGCRFPHILDNGTDARNPEVVAAAQAAFNAARKAAIVHSTPEESVQVAAQAAAVAAAAASAQVAANAAATGVPPKTMAPTQPRSAKPVRPVTAPVESSPPAAAVPTGPASASTTPPVETPSLPVAPEQEETSTVQVPPSAPSQPTPSGPAAQNKAPNGIPARPANANGHGGAASLPGRPANGHRNENGQQGNNGNSNGNNNRNGEHGGKSGSGKKKNNNNNNQNQQHVTVPIPHQRLPKMDDFPALAPSTAPSAVQSPGPTSSGQSAAGSATEASSPELPAATPAPAASAPAPKVNWSAVLSAPAPAKKAAAPAATANGTNAEDDSENAATAPSSKPVVANGTPTAPNGVEKAAEKAVPNGNHGPSQKGPRHQPQANGHAHKAAPPAPVAPQVPEEDEDGFSMVKPRKRAAAQQTHQHPTHAHQQISHSKAVVA